jgi:hypothetical protein
MRGSSSLFTDLLDTKVSASKIEKRKGRSADLIKARNECLVARYYFYLNFSERRYEIIVELLSKEFFISTVTIPELLSKNIQLLENFRKNKTDKTYFDKKYPHLKWS